MASVEFSPNQAQDGGDHRTRAVDDRRPLVRGRLGGDDLRHQPEPRGHHHRGHPRDAEGRRAQPGPRLRVRRGLHAGVVRRRGRQARPVRADRRGLARQREDQRRRPLDGLRRQPHDRPADHHERVGRPARAEGRGRRRDRDVRHLRRHPRDEEQPDRRDGRARLPRLELEVEGRHPDRQHPRLPGPAGQHDRDADAPRLRARGDGTGARARRGRPPRQRCSAAPRTRAATARRSTRWGTSPPSTAPTTAAW